VSTVCLPLSHHPAHGGQLDFYAKHYGIAKSEWLDLSTGINPNAYPQALLPEYVLRDLPSEDDGLEQVACEYYGCDALLMVPGSSWAITQLPMTLKDACPDIKSILLPCVGYKEHEKSWRALDVEMVFYDGLPSDKQLEHCDVCVLINPNNPTADLYTREDVLAIAEKLKCKKSVLIVDEAFMDATPQHSVITDKIDNVIVLRSLGKFFGLAGLRVGSIIANTIILNRLRSQLPPWALSHPARFVAKQALQDKQWITQTQDSLKQQSESLKDLCESVLLPVMSNIKIVKNPLFVTIFFDSSICAQQYHHYLAEQGILTRLLDEKNSIRLGLPGNSKKNWQRLNNCLQKMVIKSK
jgi:cobalamin biosynthetic protein CobC